MCNTDQKDGKKRNSSSSLKDEKGIYVGESSRSLHERAKEHEADKRKLSEDSHQIKHWLANIGYGGGERKRAIEHHLRDERETEEAAKKYHSHAFKLF